MVVSISLAFTALLFAANVAADQDGNAYVRLNITQTSLSCVAFPEKDICPDLMNITVASVGLDNYVYSVTQVNSSMHTFGRSLGANVGCIEAVIKQQCLGIPRCVGDGQGQAVDSDAALGECRSARSLCPTAINDAFLDCDAKQKQYENQTFTSDKASCATIQDPNNFCPDVKYKRYNSSLHEYANIFKQIKSAIEPLKGKTTDECYKKVKALACSNLGACSDDGKYLLALFNQKNCNATVECIPESDRHQIKSHLCSDAPDADNPNVQKVPYPTGFETSSIAPSRMVSTTPGNASITKGPGKTTPMVADKTTKKAASMKDTTFLLFVAVFSTCVTKSLVY